MENTKLNLKSFDLEKLICLNQKLTILVSKRQSGISFRKKDLDNVDLELRIIEKNINTNNID